MLFRRSVEPEAIFMNPSDIAPCIFDFSPWTFAFQNPEGIISFCGLGKFFAVVRAGAAPYVHDFGLYHSALIPAGDQWFVNPGYISVNIAHRIPVTRKRCADFFQRHVLINLPDLLIPGPGAAAQVSLCSLYAQCGG